MLQTSRSPVFHLALLQVMCLCGWLAAPSAASQEWQRAAAEEVGLDGERLAAFVRDLGEGEHPGVTSLVIVRRGKLAAPLAYGEIDTRRAPASRSGSAC